jgi:hypothetical protein
MTASSGAFIGKQQIDGTPIAASSMSLVPGIDTASRALIAVRIVARTSGKRSSPVRIAVPLSHSSALRPYARGSPPARSAASSSASGVNGDRPKAIGTPGSRRRSATATATKSE